MACIWREFQPAQEKLIQLFHFCNQCTCLASLTSIIEVTFQSKPLHAAFGYKHIITLESKVVFYFFYFLSAINRK